MDRKPTYEELVQKVDEFQNEADKRRRAEVKLREHEQLLRKFVAHTPAAIAMCDREMRYMAYNRRWAIDYGLGEENLMGRSHYDAFPDLPEHWKQEHRECLAGEIINRDEEPFPRSDGSIDWVKRKLCPWRDDTDKIGGLIMFTEVITASKEARDALRESEEKFRILFDTAPVLLNSFDENGRCILWNKECEKLFGWTIEELNSHENPLALRYPDPEMQREVLAAATSQPEKAFREWHPITKSGEERIISWSNVRLPSGMIINIGHDITDRKRAEEQISASLKEKEVLLREIHHRTKNNMQVMISLLKIQSANIEDKQVAGMFKESRDRIKSMSLVHEKLYQSKGLADVDFKGYVKSLVNSIFSSYGANAAGITPTTETDDVSIGLETAIPCGLIINELVSNSLKYAFPGNRKGEIRVALRSFDEDALVLEVGDNGIGMPEDLDFRNTATMGLHLVNILSEDQLHGKIELDRAGGTTFRIRFKNHKYEARI